VSIGKRENESNFEAFVNPVITGTTIMTILFFTSELIFLAATLALAWGDGLGEIIGRPYGKHKYTIPFHPQKLTKSYEGSVSVFIGTILGIYVSFYVYGELQSGLFFVSLIVALIVALVEAIYFPILSKLIDNVLVPLSTAIGLIVGMSFM
jgi:phytol kinase